MIKSAPIFLGLRYLRPRRSFVSVITLISVCGVMLGVAVMVIVMSIFKGWQVEFRKLLLGFEPHVLVTQDVGGLAEGEEGSNWRGVLERAQKMHGVRSAMPVAKGVVVLDAGQEMEAMEVLGLKPEASGGLVERLQKHLKEGQFDLEGYHLILTDKMAQKIGVKLGDTITVNSVKNVEHMVKALQEIEAEKAGGGQTKEEAYEEAYVVGEDLVVAGILREDTAGARGYLPLHLAQSLFGLEDRVTGISMDLEDPERAPEVASMLMGMTPGLEDGEWLPLDWYPETWQDVASFQLQVVENQQSLLYFLLLFIVFVAAICVMNTTITVTVQKRREIGILTALGTRGGQVIGIFLSQALVVAVVGMALGVALGAVALAFRNDMRAWIAEVTGKDFFPQEIYFLSSIPSQIVVGDLMSICGMALVLCVLAALIPAWIAARVDPAVALRD